MSSISKKRKFMAIENVKRGKYILELKPGYSLYKQINAPQFGAFGAKDLNGLNFSLGWSFLTEPFLMVAEPHSHDFDQIVFFTGGDPSKVTDFDGEVEFGLEGVNHFITYASCVFIPKGVVHGPLNIKKVSKPMMFIDVTLSTGPSIRPLPKASER
jgi:hypothetical protein